MTHKFYLVCFNKFLGIAYQNKFFLTYLNIRFLFKQTHNNKELYSRGINRSGCSDEGKKPSN